MFVRVSNLSESCVLSLNPFGCSVPCVAIWVPNLSVLVFFLGIRFWGSSVRILYFSNLFGHQVLIISGNKFRFCVLNSCSLVSLLLIRIRSRRRVYNLDSCNGFSHVFRVLGVELTISRPLSRSFLASIPTLAAIGEKEWFFYVPRDRKYRNGDRPNRVTTSGYWKATGADRMIKTETSRSIGLKKTLVFYSGKAPKGIRTSWIMNEYRLPQHETEKYQKAEISLCRVYKRAGVEDHPSVLRSIHSRASSSRGPQPDKKMGQPHITSVERYHPYAVGQSQQLEMDKISTETDGSCSNSDVGTALGLSKTNLYTQTPASTTSVGLVQPTPTPEDIFLNQSRQLYANLFATSSGSASSNAVDDLHRLVNSQQAYISHQQQQQQPQPQPQQQQLYSQQQLPQTSPFGAMSPQLQPLAFNVLPNSLPNAFPERLWEWNPMPEASRDQYNVDNPFK